MRNVKCADCAEYKNEWCDKVIDSPYPDMVRDCKHYRKRGAGKQNMRMIIEIPEEMHKALEQGSFGAKYNIYDLVGCIMNGTILPDDYELQTRDDEI